MDHHAAVVRPTVSLRRFGAIEATDVHDFHQVVLGLDGAMVMAVDGMDREIDSRSAWLVPAGARHDYAGIGENRQLVLDLPASSLAVPQRLFDRARAVGIGGSLTELVRTVAASATGTAHANDEARVRQFNWNAAAQLCAAILSDSGATASTASGAGALPAFGLDFVRIDHWLRARLSEPLRIADLAAHCGFGMRRFHQLFIEAFGETPHRYLQRLRLDTSLTRLADPRHALSDIALDIGFGDQSAFTHAFTRRFGLAPGQWRALQH